MKNEELAVYENRGKDKCCSYCGSWHPVEFLSFLKTVAENEDSNYRIELNTRRDKIYITRPHIKNATHGAIKIYLFHLKLYCDEMGYDAKEIDRQIHKAIMVSKKKFKKRYNDMLEKMKS